MNRRLLTGAAALLVAGAGLAAQQGVAPPPPAPPPAAQAPRSDEGPATTLDDQVDLALTVYNSNLALVRDVRQLALPTGTFPLRFMDVAASINPATVHLRSLTEPARLSVLEQNYEHDLLEPDRLLRKYVGRRVTLVRERQEGGSTKVEEIDALLLAYNNGPVWKIGSEIVTGMRADHYRFPELPENLHSHPTLIWTLQNEGASKHQVEASYLAGNLSWRADYVLTVGRDDRSADLAGWVTLQNNSGTTFRNARLQLIAGELHRVAERMMRQAADVEANLAMAPPPPQFEREAFSEYHLYTLSRRTSVRDQETKQISLLAAPSVPVEKRYRVDGQQFYYRNEQQPGAPIKDAVKVYYRFRNDEASGLGMPMPAGVVRVYQADQKGGLQFAGEDRITHTPKDETLDIHTGNAFDIVAERRQTDYRRISSNTYEMAFEIAIRNHKDTAITVEVNEPIGGDWQMLSSSHKWEKAGAFAARFQVPVTAGGAARLVYHVRARW